jgi:hypothetical protein
VRKARGGLRLTAEPLTDIQLECQLGRKNLDGDAALEAIITGAVHDAHPAPSNLALDCVGISQGFGETNGEGPVCSHGNNLYPRGASGNQFGPATTEVCTLTRLSYSTVH